MAEIVVSAEGRTDRGKNAARRLRVKGLIPAVVYGGKGEALAVAVDPKALQRVLRSETGRNTILKLDLAGEGKTSAILKQWQVDPVKENFLHAVNEAGGIGVVARSPNDLTTAILSTHHL